MIGSRKMEVDYLEQRWTTWILWKDVIKPSDIHCWECVVCGEKTPVCSTVFNRVCCFNSGKEIAQAAAHEWYHSTPKE